MNLLQWIATVGAILVIYFTVLNAYMERQFLGVKKMGKLGNIAFWIVMVLVLIVILFAPEFVGIGSDK